MSDLTEAVANTDWTLRTPRLARRPVHDWLVGYVAAVLDQDGEVDHYQWWVATCGRVVATSSRDDWDGAAGAVTDADAALAALARVGPQ